MAGQNREAGRLRTLVSASSTHVRELLALTILIAALVASSPGALSAQTPPVALLPLGDSITHGNAAYQSYRYPLWQGLVDAGLDADFIGSLDTNAGGNPPFPDYQGEVFDLDHEGHSGFRADEVRDGLGIWLPGYTPEVALVHLGTNDILQGQTPSSTASEIGEVIDLLRADNPAVTVLVAQIIPIGPAFYHGAVNELNDEIATLVASKTTPASPVLLVDQFSGFDPATDTYDGVHPTASGEQKMADRWLEVILGLPDAPAIAGFSPQPGSSGVELSSSVSVVFDQAMDPATIGASTVTLAVAGGAPVAATVSYDPIAHVATVDPLEDLQSNSTYEVRVLGGVGGVSSAQGAALPSTYVYTFATSFDATLQYLSDIEWSYAANGWGPVELDRNSGEQAAGDGGPLILDGVVYPKGLGVHADSHVEYDLGGACTTFSAYVGLDDAMDGEAGSVQFEVWTDGTRVFQSPVMIDTSPTAYVNVDVTGVQELALLVNDGGNNNWWDWADWADAQLYCPPPGPDTTPPTVILTAPADGAVNQPTLATPSATFSEAMDVATLTGATVTLAVDGGAAVGAGVSYDAATRTVRLTPSSALSLATTYRATIASASDEAGNPLAGPVSWTFTTVEVESTGEYLSDLEWTYAANGWGPVELDRNNGENVGGDGGPLVLNGVVFDKGLGVHASSHVEYDLGGTCSTFSAFIGLDDAMNGEAGSVQFEVWTDGAMIYQSPIMTDASATQHLNLDVTGAQELALLVNDGGNNNWWDWGNWADAKIDCPPPGPDTTAPTVVSTSPADGATDQLLALTPSATFSEAMDAATLTGASVTLAVDGGADVSAAVSYDPGTRTVTLTPAAPLAVATTYRATVASAADEAGNALGGAVSWTFATIAAQSTGQYLSDLDWTFSANGWGPAELDRNNGENVGGDGGPLVLNGVTYAKGLGVHASSHIEYDLGGTCATFSAYIGLDDAMNGEAGSVQFEVWLDGAMIYQSPIMTDTSPTQYLNLDVTGAQELALLVNDGGNNNWWDWGNWADARIDCPPPAPDTTAPTVVATSPADGAADQSLLVVPSATFSEAMDTATLNGGTVTLAVDGGSAVGAIVAYDAGARTVSVTPLATLAPLTTFRVTVAGASDVAGNPLAAPVSWTFVTASAEASATQYLSEIDPVYAANGWGPMEIDRNNGEIAGGDGGPLVLDGVLYSRGLGVHAGSHIEWTLGGACSSFRASIGLDDAMDGEAGSVQFEVWIDGVRIFNSGVMIDTSPTQVLDLDVTSAEELALIVTDGGNNNWWDWADWAEARVVCSSPL